MNCGSPIVGWIGEELGPRVDFLIAAAVAIGVGTTVLWVRGRREVASSEPEAVAAAS